MTGSSAPPPARRRNPLLGPDAAPFAEEPTVEALAEPVVEPVVESEPDPTGDVAAPISTAAEPAGFAATSRAPRRDTRSVSRRIDPSGKHALFSTPPTAAPDQLRAGSRENGRSAFYSTGSRQAGTVVVECAACTTRTRVTLVDLGIRFLSISAWIPGRSHSHWMRCPACDTHTWCRVRWTD